MGTDLEDDVEMDLMALGSSFITDDSDNSINFENRNNEAKKLRLDNLDSNIPAVDAGLEHFEFEEVEEVAAQIERGYWDNMCHFWNKQHDLERTPSDVGLPSWSSGVEGSEKLNK